VKSPADYKADQLASRQRLRQVRIIPRNLQPGQIVQMSDRQYQKESDGSLRLVRMNIRQD